MFRAAANSVCTATCFLAIALAGVAPAIAAPSCELPGTTLRDEEAVKVSEAFKGFVLGNAVGAAQDRYAQSLIESFMQRADAADELSEAITFSIKADLVGAANKWVHLLKTANIAEGIANGDLQPIKDWVRDDTAELAIGKFLERLGVASSSAVPGLVMLGLQNLKESYDELEHQDCLLGIDIAYYNFLDDPSLRAGDDGNVPKSAVDTYIQSYLRGGGPDPQGNPRELNRRYLQCFINATMPEGQRIEVSTLGADAAEPTSAGNFLARAFGGVTDAMRSAVDAAPGNTRIRAPVLIMLKDFNARYEVEQERRKLIRLVQSAEFANFQETIDVMKLTEDAAQWLCDRLGSKDLAELAGKWKLTLSMQAPFSSDDFPLPEYAFEVAENGMVLSKQKDKSSDLTIEGRVGAERVALDYLMRGWDDDANAMVQVFNLDLDGTVTETAMQGKFEGQMVDMRCVMEALFADDDEVTPTCGMLAANGTWTAVPE